MIRRLENILVTGGAGFIGSNFTITQGKNYRKVISINVICAKFKGNLNI